MAKIDLFKLTAEERNAVRKAMLSGIELHHNGASTWCWCGPRDRRGVAEIHFWGGAYAKASRCAWGARKQTADPTGV
jgi:hypothetical protein